MASYDRQFEILLPSSLDKLSRGVYKVATAALLDPTQLTSLIQGEFVQFDANGQLVRGTDATKLSFATIEDRGDTGVQVTRKLSVIRAGGYEADTIVFNTGLLTLGAPVMLGTVNNSLSGSTNRGGLVAWAATALFNDPQNLVLGYVTKLAAANGGRLRFQQTLV